MSHAKSRGCYMMRGLEKLQEECATHGFLTPQEEVVSSDLEKELLDRSRKWSQNSFTPFFAEQVSSFPMQDVTASNILKFFYSSGRRCQSRGEVVAAMKARNANYFASVFEFRYESFVRTVAWVMQRRLIHYLRMEKPHCTLSFQERCSPCGKPLLLMYVTFTPTQLKEQVTLFLGMIPITLQADSIGELHQQVLTDFNKFVSNNKLGEYLAECLVSVNATPVCSDQELLIGDCLLAVMNRKYRSQNNRVVWCCNPKVVFHRVLNALYFIFSRRTFHRNATSHRFSDMFQFSLYFLTRLQTFCLSYKQQIQQVMEGLSLSLSFPQLFFADNAVAISFQRMMPNANMLYLPALVEDLPIVYRVLQEIVSDEANWNSNVRMCSKALILRKVIEQPKFLPFMTLLKKTVHVFSVFKSMDEPFECLSKLYKPTILLDSMEKIMEQLLSLRNQFPSDAFASYEIETKAGQWMSLNRRDNVSLGFNPCDRHIRYKLGSNRYVYFAKNRFNEEEQQVTKIFNTLVESTKSSFCKYTKDYCLLSKFMAVDFLPLCEQNRNYYFDLIMDEIRHFSSYDATEALCESWSIKDCPGGNTKMNKKTATKIFKNNRTNLSSAKLDTFFFDDYDALAKGAYYVRKLPTLTDDSNIDTTEASWAYTVNGLYVYTAEAFVCIAYNGVGVDRFNMSTEEFKQYIDKNNVKPDDLFAGKTKVDFTNWLFGK